MIFPPLIGKLEIRREGTRFELWHQPPGRTDWEWIGSVSDEATAAEWKAIADIKEPGVRAQGEDRSADGQPSRAVSFDFTADGDSDHGVPIWPAEPQSEYQSLMEAPPGGIPAPTVHERQDREEAQREALADRLSGLTVKQRMVVDLLLAGWSQADVARELGVDKTSVRDYVRRIRAALETPDRIRIHPSTHPERYAQTDGPPEAWCDMCTPPQNLPVHSGECAAKTWQVRYIGLPRGVRL